MGDADYVREHTGFAIGGVPPAGHPERIPAVIDEDLLRYEEVWAAAGNPRAVFPLSPQALMDLAGARPADVAQRAVDRWHSVCTSARSSLEGPFRRAIVRSAWHSSPTSAKTVPFHPVQCGGSTHMKLKPLGDRLIVRAIEEEETTASGLVLPDTAKEKPQKGKVLAVGDGTRRRGRQAHPARRRRGRRGPLQQVRRHRDQGRRRGSARPPRVRRARQGRVLSPKETPRHMAHKELKYDADARKALEAGVDAVANAVKVTLGPQGPLRRPRQEVRRPDDHQRRRHHRS